jgi:SOS-response transcriptional repressor LexA
LRVPLIGGISAGTGILAFQEPSDYYVTSDVASGGDYALRVHGFSMIGDNITDGDVVLVKEQATALPGDIAVVLMLGANLGVDDEVTLKRIGSQPMLMSDGTVKVKLQASNRGKGYTFLVDADRIRIQGKVVGVIRRLA